MATDAWLRCVKTRYYRDIPGLLVAIARTSPTPYSIFLLMPDLTENWISQQLSIVTGTVQRTGMRIEALTRFFLFFNYYKKKQKFHSLNYVA